MRVPQMKKVLAAILWLVPAIGVIALSSGAQVKQPLKLVATTPLPGFSGDFDHFALDLKGKRLFLTAEDHKTVDVFDLEGKHLQRITRSLAPSNCPTAWIARYLTPRANTITSPAAAKSPQRPMCSASLTLRRLN